MELHEFSPSRDRHQVARLVLSSDFLHETVHPDSRFLEPVQIVVLVTFHLKENKERPENPASEASVTTYPLSHEVGSFHRSFLHLKSYLTGAKF